MCMAGRNLFTFLKNKMNETLNGAVIKAPSSIRGMHPKAREALEILRVSPATSHTDIATVLGLAPDVAEPFILHAKRLLLKEQLTTVTPVETALTMAPDKTEVVHGEPVTGTWIDAETGQKAVALPQIIVRMEEIRQTAQQFVDDKEDWVDTLVRNVVKVLMYVGPVVLAFFVAMLIGEQYAKMSTDFWWKPAMYAIATVTEYTLWGTSFGASREFRRMLYERSRIGTFIALVFFFMGFSGMSILAQWFVYEGHFANPDFPTTIGIIFRTCSTTGVDILALIVLAVLDYRSFKAFLQKQTLISDHVGQLSRKEVESNRIQQEEVIRQQEAEIEKERRLKHAQFFADMEAKQIETIKNGDRETRNRW